VRGYPGAQPRSGTGARRRAVLVSRMIRATAGRAGPSEPLPDGDGWLQTDLMKGVLRRRPQTAGEALIEVP
jgi:hypothetical protein